MGPELPDRLQCVCLHPTYSVGLNRYVGRVGHRVPASLTGLRIKVENVCVDRPSVYSNPNFSHITLTPRAATHKITTHTQNTKITSQCPNPQAKHKVKRKFPEEKVVYQKFRPERPRRTIHGEECHDVQCRLPHHTAQC